MPGTQSFNNQVLSAYGLTPLNLNWSLSSTGTYKTVQLLSVGTVAGKAVQGVIFNTLLSSAYSPASGTGTFATLSAFSGTTFRVDAAYNGQQMGILNVDDSTSLFTVVTGTALQTVSAADWTASYPEIRRLIQLGYH